MKTNLNVLLLLAVCATATRSAEPTFDFVLRGGRVMDPETRLDAVRDVAITGGKIVALSAAPLNARSVIDVSGNVVAPGFIDIHAHGQSTTDLLIKVRDGVTTALEMELGAFPIPGWYELRTGKSPINFGATVSHPIARLSAFYPERKIDPTADLMGVIGTLGPARSREIERMKTALRQGLREGALGIGFGINYTAAADQSEIENMFRVAAESQVPVFVHTRAFGIAAIREAIETAKAARTALHIVHVGSSGIDDLPQILLLIDSARASGMDVTTEVYPYIVAASLIESGLFNEGWQANLRISYNDVVWAATGERLTKESFDRYRKQGGQVLLHMMKAPNVELAISHPGVIIASDGMPFVNGKGHPRGAGTFARVLGYYSRERKILSLMDALAKMTILPARRLQHVPAMQTKGRLSVGADADITVFDPTSIIDRASFEAPTMPSAGIKHVIVNGTFVVRDGELNQTLMAGRPVRN